MAVKLYIIRHGIAADKEEYENDSDRPLTEIGRRKTKQVAQQLHQFGLQFHEILTSPLLRARQTAEILLQAQLGPQLTTTDSLAPNGSFTDWLNWLKPLQQSEELAIALVGHEPALSQWAELLMWGEARGILQLKKAGVIGLEIPEADDPVGNSILFWLTPPRFLILS